MEHVNVDCTCEGKRCTKCQEVLCIRKFTKDKRLRSGLKSECRVCQNAQSKRWREENREYDSERHKKYYEKYSTSEENRKKLRTRWREFEHKHRERRLEYHRKLRNRARKIKARQLTFGFRLDRASIKMNWDTSPRRKYRRYRNITKPIKPVVIRQRQRRTYEQIREARRQYYLKNKERIQKYYADNRERMRLRWQRYYHSNIEFMQKRGLEWRQKNRVRHAAYQHRRRTRKTHAGGYYTVAEWDALKAKFNFTCLSCGRQEPDIMLTADHVIPVVKGGSSDINNIQPLCRSCNSSKGQKIIDFRPQNT